MDTIRYYVYLSVIAITLIMGIWYTINWYSEKYSDNPRIKKVRIYGYMALVEFMALILLLYFVGVKP